MDPSTDPAAPASALQAPLPRITPAFVAAHYPPALTVVHVDLLHRHGERTPVAHHIAEISPRYWNLCAVGNQLHQDFMSALGHFPTGAASSSVPWQVSVFKKDGRSRGAVFGVSSTSEPHTTDTSTPSGATCGFGQLTDRGRQSMTALGAHMRALYVDALQFLPDAASSSTMYLRTTSYSRTLESLQHTLGGLYPDLSADRPPLRINVRPPEVDNMFPDFGCKNMVRTFARLNAQALEDCAAEYKQLRHDLQKVPALRPFLQAEAKSGKARLAISVMDIIGPMRVHGMPLPEEIDDALIARVSRMAAAEYLRSGWKSAALTRMQIGRLVHELSENLVHAVEADRTASLAPTTPRLGVYSGHDSTLAPLLAVFGHDSAQRSSGHNYSDITWPPFAASMRIELLKDSTSPRPVVQPAWEQEQADPTVDPAKVSPDKRIRPAGVPDSLYRWSPGRTAAHLATETNPRATRDYYVRVWYNDRVLQLPTCRDPGAHHSRLGPAVCTLDGFFKQIARFSSTKDEARAECRIGAVDPHHAQAGPTS